MPSIFCREKAVWWDPPESIHFYPGKWDMGSMSGNGEKGSCGPARPWYLFRNILATVFSLLAQKAVKLIILVKWVLGGQSLVQPKDLANDVNFWKTAMPHLPFPSVKWVFSHTYWRQLSQHMRLAWPLTWKGKRPMCNVQVFELCVYITMSPTIAIPMCMNISMYVHSTTHVVTHEPVINVDTSPPFQGPALEAHSCLLQPWSVMPAASCFGELSNVNISP